jgi:acyl-CoA dehydrogenase
MPVYKAPVEDTLFLLNDVFQFERYNNLPGFTEATPDLVEAVLGEGAKLCEEVLQPINHSGDQEGCKRNADGSVTTPKGFKQAYEAYAAGGWIGLAMDP